MYRVELLGAELRSLAAAGSSRRDCTQKCLVARQELLSQISIYSFWRGLEQRVYHSAAHYYRL
jgi:hypothetical protein